MCTSHSDSIWLMEIPMPVAIGLIILTPLFVFLFH